MNQVVYILREPVQKFCVFFNSVLRKPKERKENKTEQK